jgi:hypothetical protein
MAMCPGCGAHVPDSWVACPSCGRALSPATVPLSGPPPPLAAAAAPVGTAYPYPYPVAQRSTNGFAVASMVLGILWIYWIGSILAVVFGYIAKRQIDDSNGWQTGRGMAMAGIVLGWVGIGVIVIGLAVWIIVAAGASSSYG